MKNFLYIAPIVLLTFSCTSGRKTSAVAHRAKPPRSAVENVPVDPATEEETSVDMPGRIVANTDIPGSIYSTDIEKSNGLQFKYAILLEEPVESVTNEKLIRFLEEWYGTPYQYGGDNKKGIDCSAFTGIMMDTVYKISLPRTAAEQYRDGKKITKQRLMQGDLVFFNTTGGISHVGVYLGNNKFVHASSSSGVMISDLDDAYFKRRYVGSARVR